MLGQCPSASEAILKNMRYTERMKPLGTTTKYKKTSCIIYRTQKPKPMLSILHPASDKLITNTIAGIPGNNWHIDVVLLSEIGYSNCKPCPALRSLVEQINSSQQCVVKTFDGLFNCIFTNIIIWLFIFWFVDAKVYIYLFGWVIMFVD